MGILLVCKSQAVTTNVARTGRPANDSTITQGHSTISNKVEFILLLWPWNNNKTHHHKNIAVQAMQNTTFVVTSTKVPQHCQSDFIVSWKNCSGTYNHNICNSFRILWSQTLLILSSPSSTATTTCNPSSKRDCLFNLKILSKIK